MNEPRPFEWRHSEERIARGLVADWVRYPAFALVFEGAVIGQISAEIDDANWANLGYGIMQEHWGKASWWRPPVR